MDPANVSWFFGTYAVSFATYVLLSTIPAAHHSLWIFLASVRAPRGVRGRLGHAATAGLADPKRTGGSPGGVGRCRRVTVALLKVIRVWPDSLGNPFTDFSGYTLAVAVVTAVAGLAAFAVTRFPFVLALVVTPLLLAAQLVAASGVGDCGRSRDGRAGGRSRDRRRRSAPRRGRRRRDAFWFTPSAG